jgi:hypothetical protein
VAAPTCTAHHGGVPDPVEPSLSEASPPVTSLSEPSPPVTSLSEPSPPVTSLSEPSPLEASISEASLSEAMGPSASPGDGAGVEVEVLFEDHGSFAHGVCRACGWIGPGRRSRRLAACDADEHLESCAPGRERLTARGRS